MLYFSQVYSLYFFLIFAHFWGLGVELGFWDWGFQLMEFGAYGVGPSRVFGFGTLYINNHRRLNLEKTLHCGNVVTLGNSLLSADYISNAMFDLNAQLHSVKILYSIID